MTQWFSARQREKDQRFDMTVSNSSGTNCYPIGYCAGWPTMYDTPSEAHHICDVVHVERERDRHLPNKHKFHKDGHATAKEADECYKQYKIDSCEIFVDLNTQRKCLECGDWTTGRMLSRGEFAKELVLCVLHQAREFVEKNWDKVR